MQTKKVKSELVRELRTKFGELESNLNVGFQYKDPVKDFDRSSVKGMVAKLFSVADISNATALEVNLVYKSCAKAWLVWGG